MFLIDPRKCGAYDVQLCPIVDKWPESFKVKGQIKRDFPVKEKLCISNKESKRKSKICFTVDT